MEESIVSITRSTRTAGSGRSTRNMVAATLPSPASVRAMTMPTEAPTAPVMKALRPLVPAVAVRHGGGLQHGGVGAGAVILGGFGHEEGGARLTAEQGSEEAALLSLAGDLAQQVHISLV